VPFDEIVANVKAVDVSSILRYIARSREPVNRATEGYPQAAAG
jgi:hypothetical protein